MGCDEVIRDEVGRGEAKARGEEGGRESHGERGRAMQGVGVRRNTTR